MNINKEYCRCKRNFALCHRLDKKRRRKEKAEYAKAIRKVNSTYMRCKRHYFMTTKREERTKHRIYKGKVKWCKKHFGESIENCKLCDECLEELGSPIILFNILYTIGFLLLPLTILILGIYRLVKSSDQYIVK